jgi:hypothetical protein
MFSLLNLILFPITLCLACGCLRQTMQHEGINLVRWSDATVTWRRRVLTIHPFLATRLSKELSTLDFVINKYESKQTYVLTLYSKLHFNFLRWLCSNNELNCSWNFKSVNRPTDNKFFFWIHKLIGWMGGTQKEVKDKVSVSCWVIAMNHINLGYNRLNCTPWPPEHLGRPVVGVTSSFERSFPTLTT